jgi:hypothetical protein
MVTYYENSQKLIILVFLVLSKKELKFIIKHVKIWIQKNYE